MATAGIHDSFTHEKRGLNACVLVIEYINMYIVVEWGVNWVRHEWMVGNWISFCKKIKNKNRILFLLVDFLFISPTRTKSHLVPYWPPSLSCVNQFYRKRWGDEKIKMIGFCCHIELKWNIVFKKEKQNVISLVLAGTIQQSFSFFYPWLNFYHQSWRKWSHRRLMVEWSRDPRDETMIKPAG